MVDLSDIVTNGQCLGCGACVAALNRPGFEMAIDADGYMRPSTIELDKAEEFTLASVCAGHSLSHDEIGPDYNELWGPVRRVATGFACDPEVRFKGSSGGVLSALAIHLIETREVGFVLATSADPSDPIGNITLPRDTKSDIVSAAGSRYAPSSPLAELEKHLVAGIPFAFIGKPCDVAALRKMAKLDERIDALIPYKLAFFCAGVPSRHGSEAVLDKLGVAQADVARFQYRGDGWPGLARARRHDGSEESMTYEASWGSILNKHLQFRCKICPDGTGEFADVSCADAWYGKDGYPDFEEREGRSLIVARTDAGLRLLAAAEARNAVKSDPLAIEEIARMQPYQVTRKRNVLARTVAVWGARGGGPRFRNLGLMSLSLKTSPAELLRNFWGTFRRSRRAHIS